MDKSNIENQLREHGYIMSVISDALDTTKYEMSSIKNLTPIVEAPYQKLTFEITITKKD